MITATTWVPRGFAAPFPTKYVFDEEEFERISTLAKLQLDDAKEDLQGAQKESYGGSKKEGLNESQNDNRDVLKSHE
jgi:periodic tryptophan protein 1